MNHLKRPLTHFFTHHLPTNLIHHRHITKVRLKWVKNRSLDHIISTETDLKAAVLLKDSILRSTTGHLTSQTFESWQKPLGITVPVLRFMRRYRTLFTEFLHARYKTLPCFKLTDTALFLNKLEQQIYNDHEFECVEKLCKILMMVRNGNKCSNDGNVAGVCVHWLPLKSIYPLKWDLGLPNEFYKRYNEKYPEYLKVFKGVNGGLCLGLSEWREELAVSVLQKRYERNEKLGVNGARAEGLEFPLNFPRGYGRQTKVKKWMDGFQKLPYVSPDADSNKIDPSSDLMEKRVVAVLHEILSLTIHKKMQRNYLTCMIEELRLPMKFTRIFTRYPGIFYLSLKCKKATASLKEGYARGRLVDPHPLNRVREKFCYVMRSGVLYRNKKVEFIPDEVSPGSEEETQQGGSEIEETEEEEEIDLNTWSESDDE